MKILVVTPYKHEYNNYIDRNLTNREDVVWGHGTNSIMGRTFDKVVLLRNYLETDLVKSDWLGYVLASTKVVETHSNMTDEELKQYMEKFYGKKS